LQTVFLRHLRFVVRWPILAIRRALGNLVRNDNRRLAAAVPFLNESRGNGVFTRLLAENEIFASAADGVKRHPVLAGRTRLRRHLPNAVRKNDLRPRRKLQRLQFSQVHDDHRAFFFDETRYHYLTYNTCTSKHTQGR
jgi:hypothetical protein